MSTISVDDSFQFQNTLLKLRRDKSSVVTNSKSIEKMAEEGKIIVLRGSPRFVLMVYGIFLLIIIGMVLIWTLAFDFFDLSTIIIVLSVWVGTGIFYLTVVSSLLLIIHPDGFLIRRLIFFKYSQTWNKLTQAPKAVMGYDSEGGKWYNLYFNDYSGRKRINVGHFRIKDIKKADDRMKFIEKIVLEYFNEAK
ncbi:MAG: hypothetical protein ACTSRE_03740 [Promethearchaeota archaeon]